MIKYIYISFAGDWENRERKREKRRGEELEV
jgi:hypothetical protein